uniref:Putative replication protein VP4 n=1 Tax=uncultured marine virus TaxID=186617 RepID=A0A1J0KK49_9VIRU|nr:putative replication protein VP4 [uncultured marine virus]
MACFKPLEGYRTPSGGWTSKRKDSTGQFFNVPCGQCIGCRLDYSISWAIRCLHEASLHDANSFITLTYNPLEMPRDGSLNKKHFQDFIKRLRKSLEPNTIRYYHCGEYGPKYERPHYHALIFGHDFPDKTFWKPGPKGHKLYRSETLEQLWPQGFSLIGEVTSESAAYCARYSMKKIRGKALQIIDPDTALKPYERLDENTGEILQLQPEYSTMSTNPGIGRNWYETFKDDVFPDDFVIYKGRRTKTPQYYRRLLEKESPELAERLRKIRQLALAKHHENNTRQRLDTREKVKLAQTQTLGRDYETGT